MKKKRLLSLLLTGALCLSLSAPALAAGLENFQKTNPYTAGQFTDVPAGEWYAANVQAAYELGLMEGSSETTFNPSGNLTIAEALVLACRLHSTYVGDGATFAGSGGAWYQPYVDYAVETAILSPGTYSDYTATATRAQFASILAAALPAEARRPSTASPPSLTWRRMPPMPPPCSVCITRACSPAAMPPGASSPTPPSSAPRWPPSSPAWPTPA